MIQVEDLCKSFGEKKVLNQVSFTLEPGVVTAVMAASGVGKTTLLRILMGLEKPDSGRILGLEGLRLSAVFQEDRLCENLSPLSNVQLVTGKAIEKKEISASLEAVGLGGCACQPVRELSGGQRRRAALVRALCPPWDLLLLDEPFKGLDHKTRQMVMEYVRKCLLSRPESYTVLVTHDREEAEYLAEQVIFLERV